MIAETLVDVKITEEQFSYLNSFTCERLSSNEINNFLTADFYCQRNHNLVDYLQNDAWKHDENGERATYLIKNSCGEIVFYFSLQTGSLFSHVYTEIELKEEIQSILEKEFGIEEFSNIEDGISMAFQRKDNESGKKILYYKYRQYLDQKSLNNSRPIKVTQTYPSIELSLFCKNDFTKKKWDSNLIPYPMGVVFFWKFVADIIEQTRKFIGFQFLFLFAADNSQDSSLIAYYQESFKMQTFDAVKMNVKKPEFDFYCTPLCCDITSLFKNRDLFFEHFNEPVQPILDKAV